MSVLPDSFPASALLRIDRSKVEWFYRRYVIDYHENYLFGHFIFAAYASVPALLTADLLYKIWQNFNLYHWNGSPVQIHRIAVADVLMSPLCQVVGNGLYEMDENIRNCFLEWLEKESKSEVWANRLLHPPQQIAIFLREYHRRQNPGEKRWGPAYQELQQWNILTLLEPEEAQGFLHQKLEQSINQDQKNQALRILDFWSKSNKSVQIIFDKDPTVNSSKIQDNSSFANAWKALLHRNSDAFMEQITANPQLVELLNDQKEGGIPVKVPKVIKSKIDKLSEQINTTPQTAQLFALLVGIGGHHPSSNVFDLKGPANDLKEMERFLKVQYPQLLGQKSNSNIRLLQDAEATREKVIKNFVEHLGQAKEKDFILFYFSGNGSTEIPAVEFREVTPEDIDSTLVCYDSRLPGQYDLSSKELAWMIDQVPAGVQKIIIIDACHSGGMTRNTQPIESEESRTIKGRTERRPLSTYLLPGEGFYLDQKKGSGLRVPIADHILLAAAAQNETAIETADRGLFSFYLLDTLQKTKGQISYQNLMRRVRFEVQKLGLNQTPSLSIIRDFNSDLKFLSNETTKSLNHYPIIWDHGLKLQLGQVHGILPHDHLDEVLLRIFPKGHPKGQGIEAQITSIGVEESTLLAGGADPNTTYEAEIIYCPTYKTLIGLIGPAEKRDQILKLNQNIQSPYIELVDAAEGIEYVLEYTTEKGQELVRIIHLPSDLVVSGAQAPTGELKWSLEELMPILERVEKWERYKVLEKRASRINETRIDIKLELEQEDGLMREIPTDKTEITVDVNKASNEEDWENVGFRLSLNNRSQEDLYVLLIGMSREYGISVYFNDWIDGKLAEVELLDDAFTLPAHLSREVDVLKFIISTEELTPSLYTQDVLELGKITKKNRAVRGYVKEIRNKNAAKKEDWFSKTIIITVSGNESTIGTTASTINGMTFQKNEHLSAKLSFGSINTHIRGTNPIYRLPALLKDSDLEIMDFSQTQGDGDKCIIELHDIHNEEQLVNQPLEIMLPDKMEEGEMIIPVTFDGEFILPFGEVKETADKRAMVSIDHLPAQADDGRRSVTRALKFVLLRTVVKDSSNAFKLRWYDYDVSERRQKTEDLKGKVAEADKVLLLIHGIIGDTEHMAKQLKFALQEKIFDLVLTYDYENLDTDIKVVADKLDEDLTKVGLGSGQNKQLTIIAHSTGGLVCRYLVEELRKNDGSVKKLIMLGSPNGGMSFGAANDQSDNYQSNKIGALTSQEIHKWYKFALAFAFNLRPQLTNKILSYLYKIAQQKEKESIKLLQPFNTLAPESDFIQSLENNSIPSQTSYFAIAGDISGYESQGDRFGRFVNKVEAGIGKVVHFGTPYDLLIDTASVFKIRALPKENTKVVNCHIFEYLTNEESLDGLKGFLEEPVLRNEERYKNEDITTAEQKIPRSNVILFLPANPSKTALLRLRDEHSNIAIELQSAPIKVKSAEAVSLSELSKVISKNKPRIIHFSGHGDLKVPEVEEAYRIRGIDRLEDKKENPGIIILDNAKRTPAFAKPSVLKRTFRTLIDKQGIPIEAVIFNACHSDEQAKAISELGITVIGISHEIKKEAAFAFSNGFYFLLAQGETILDSFDWSMNQAIADGETEDRFTLFQNGDKVGTVSIDLKSNFINGYSLIIGVGGNLPDTIPNAQKVYDTITDQERAGYPEEQVILCLGENATRAKVLTAFQTLQSKIEADQNQEATVMVYYSGYGGLDKKQADTPFYFLTHAYYTADFSGTCIEGSEFSDLLSKLSAEKLIVLLDCCYAGQLKAKAGREDEDEDDFSSHLKQNNKRMINVLDQGAGRIIIASSTTNQVSYIGNQGLSIFTEVLTEALAGKNTEPEEAHVSFSDVWAHLGKEVNHRAQLLYQKPQEPVINAQDAPFFYLCRNLMEAIVETPKVFILNAPKDDNYLQVLNKLLRGLARRGKITHWDPNKIIASNSISATLDKELNEAQIVVLLVSADYLASDRCYDIQEKAIGLGKTILPVIVRHCLYEDDDYINDQPKLPMQDGEVVPISAWTYPDEAFAQVAAHIQAIARNLQK